MWCSWNNTWTCHSSHNSHLCCPLLHCILRGVIPRQPRIPSSHSAGAHVCSKVTSCAAKPLLRTHFPPCCPLTRCRTALRVSCMIMHGAYSVPNTHLCPQKILLKGILKLSLPVASMASLSSMSIRPHNNNQMFQLGFDKLAMGEQPVCFHSRKLDAN